MVYQILIKYSYLLRK